MKFNTGILTGAAIGISVALTAMTATGAYAGDKVRLRMQSYLGTEADHIFKKFKNTVKEQSDGSLRVQVFRGGELIETSQLLSAVGKGTVDMVYGSSGYWAGNLDIASLESGLPGAWSSAEEAREIFSERGLGDLVREAYAEKGIYHAVTGMGNDYDILSKDPVTSLEDLSKMKLRAAPQVAKVFKKLNIPTVFLPSQELYIGLSTGTVDAVLYGGAADYELLKLNEVATNYTRLGMLTPGWTDAYLVNMEKWEGLSDEHKKILQAALEQTAQDIFDWQVEGNKAAEAKELYTYYDMPAEDLAKIVDAAQEVWAEEAARSERNAKAVEILRAYAKEKGRL